MKNKFIVNLDVLSHPLTGIGYYTLNIVKELLTRNDVELIGVKDSGILQREQIVSLISDLFSSVSLSTSNKNALEKKQVKKIIIQLLRRVPKIYYIRHKIRSFLLSSKLSSYAKLGYVYFEPCFVPCGYTGKIITTVHDLSVIRHPEFHPEERVRYLTNELPKTLKISHKILVDSNAILLELKELYPEFSHKVNTLYLGVDSGFRVYEECDDVLSLFGLKKNSFILSVCTLEPRKNLLRLIEAYKLLPQDIRKEYPLVLVGDSGWKNAELFSCTKELFDKKEIVITNYISDEFVKKIYSSAAVFAYPSLYEGFGLPIVEAMASGTAVITSNYGAMAEVAADSAILIDPYSPDELRNAIMTLLSDVELREHFVKSGLDRAKKFNWKHTVDELIAIAMD